MLHCSLLFGAGIWLGKTLCLPPYIWWSACLLSQFAFIARRPWRELAMAGLLMGSGGILFCIHSLPLHPSDLRHFELRNAQQVTLRGQIEATPKRHIRSDPAGSKIWFETDMEASALFGTEGWQPAFGKVRVRTLGIPTSKITKGAFASIQGMLKRPLPPWGPTAQAAPDFLQRKGIYTIMEIDSVQNWQILSTSNPGWQHVFEILQKNAENQLAVGLPIEDDVLALQRAMVLGSRSSLPPVLLEPFKQTATLHLFAISGLHVSLAAGLCHGCFRLMGFSLCSCSWLSLFVVWSYTAISGFQISAIRASIMISTLLMGRALYRPTSMFNSLFAAAFLILAWDCTQLFQLGFQFSFAVVASLMAWTGPIRSVIEPILRPDPWIPRSHYTPWHALRSRIAGPVSASMAAGIAAWGGSLPILWGFFHEISLAGMLLNWLLIPLAGCVMACALGSMMCSIWMPFGATLFNHSGWFWMKLMQKLCEETSSLKWGHWQVGSLSPILLFALYTLVLLQLWAELPKSWKQIGKRITWATLLIWGAMSLGYHRETLRLTLLPIPEGDSICLRFPGRRDYDLVDGGSRYWFPRITLPLMDYQGLRSFRTWWISHGDSQHAGGVADALERFKPHQVIRPIAGKPTPTWGTIEGALEQTAIPLVEVNAGVQEEILSILHPFVDDSFAKADDSNAVYLLAYQSIQILLIGDLGREGLLRLSDRYPELRAEVVIMNRPAEATPANLHWLCSLRPSIVLITGIAWGQEDRWANQLAKGLIVNGIECWDTGRRGVIDVKVTRGGLVLNSGSGAPFRWQTSTKASPAHGVLDP